MNKYGMAAIEAANELRKNRNVTPNEAWEDSTLRIFGNTSSQSKGCPKSTFLGLCELGLIKGVTKGEFTRSKKNKEYARKSVEFIRSSDIKVFTVMQLWEKVNEGRVVKHNCQMDVVLALYENGMLEL